MARGLYSALALGLVACASTPAPKQGLELVLRDGGSEVARVDANPADVGDCQIMNYPITLGSGSTATSALRTVRVCGPAGQPSSLVEYVDVGATGATVARREQRVGDGICYVHTRQSDGTYNTKVVGCSTLPKPKDKPVEFK